MKTLCWVPPVQNYFLRNTSFCKVQKTAAMYGRKRCVLEFEKRFPPFFILLINENNLNGFFIPILCWFEQGTLSSTGDEKHPVTNQLPQHHAPKDNKLLNYEAKLHKRKSISGGSGAGGGGGRGKGHDRMHQYSTNSNSRRGKVGELVKKRGPKPKLRMLTGGRVHVRLFET